MKTGGLKYRRGEGAIRTLLILVASVVLVGCNLSIKGSASTAVSTPVACLDIQLSDDYGHRYVPNPETEPEKCLQFTPPSLYMETIMQVLIGLPNQKSCNMHDGCRTHLPYNSIKRQFGGDWPPFGFTMIGRARVENLRAAMEEIDRNQIPGAILEMGVWRGGAMMLAAAFQKEGRQRRDVYLYDAFESLPTYSEKAQSFLANSEADVRENFRLFNLLDDRIHFTKGLFGDTVTQWKKGTPIAILRVDGNFYDSYNDALYAMYEDVPVGGIVIFDDIMSHSAVMDCWSDFKRDQPKVVEDLNRIDRHSAWFRKRVAVKLNHTKKPPPRDVNLK